MSGRFSRILVGSNLKMYKTNRQTVDYLTDLQALTGDISRQGLTLFILPPYTALADACRAADHNLVRIGAQNLHWEEEGGYTGEISARMLQEIRIDLVMVGHGERRLLFHETDEMVNRRLLASLRSGFQTLLCVGDRSEDVACGASADVLRTQLKRALHGLPPEQVDRLWVAYEPLWAIGEGGIEADPQFANEMHALLRDALDGISPNLGAHVPILYGGSVNLKNAASYAHQPEVDGLFIGRAAWDAERFNQILRRILSVRLSNPG